MNKIGVITEAVDDLAIVMVGSASTCGNCGCGALTRKGDELCDDHRYIKVKNSIGANVGDPVNIEFQTAKMLKTSAILYLLPLVMLVIGIFAGNYIQGDNPNDLISFASGILLLAVLFFVLNNIDKNKDKDELITITEFKGL